MPEQTEYIYAWYAQGDENDGIMVAHEPGLPIPALPMVSSREAQALRLKVHAEAAIKERGYGKAILIRFKKQDVMMEVTA